MNRCLLALLLCSLAAPVATAKDKTPKPAPVPIYVYTEADPSGFVDADSTQRTAWVKCITTILSNKVARHCNYDHHQSKEVRVVGSAEDAVVTVELTRRTHEPGFNDLGYALSGLASTLGQRRPRPRADYETVDLIQYATLRVGTFTTELRTKNAEGLIKQLEQWVKLNQDKLLAPLP